MRYRMIGFLMMGMVLAPLNGVLPVLAQDQAFFEDVPGTHPNYFAIHELKNTAVIQGYPDNTFHPDEKVTRAEAIALVLKITARQTSITKEPNFKDVSKDEWFFGYIEQGFALGIIKGYPDGNFGPMNNVKLSEATVMALKGFQIPVSQPIDGQWYSGALFYGEQKNILDVDGGGKIVPEHEMTRAEMAEILFRMKKVKETSRPYDYSVAWQIFSHPDNYFEIKYPRGWNIFRGTRNSTVWKPDIENDQRWFSRITPGAIRVSMSFVEDGSLTGPNAWFANVKDKQKNIYGDKVKFTEQTFSGKRVLVVSNLENRMIDMYILLSTGKGLVFYGDYGSSPQNPLYQKYIHTLYGTYLYKEPLPPSPPPLTAEQKIEQARQNLLIEGAGEEILKLFEDRALIETDTIGVGTGPVDYFYSALANVTLKYERNSKTLLDLRTGQTTQF